MEKVLKFGKSNSLKLSGITASHFINDFYVGLIQPISFMFAAAFGLSLSQQGTLSVIGVIFGALLQPFFGIWIDKKDRSHLLPFSILWITTFVCLSGFISNYYLLVLSVALGSTASAFFHPLASGTTINLMKQSKGKALSVFMTFGTLGASFVPIIAIPFLNAYGLKYILLFMIPGLIIAMFLRILNIQGFTKKGSSKDHKTATKLSRNQLISVGIYIIISCLLFTPFSLLISYGVQILSLKNISVLLASFSLSAYMLAKPFGIMLGGIISDKIGPKKTILLSLITSILCYIALITFSSQYLILITFAFFGFVVSIKATPAIMIVQKLLPNNQGFAIGLMLGIPRAFGGVLLIFMGFIGDLYGMTTLFKLGLLPLVLGLIMISIVGIFEK